MSESQSRIQELIEQPRETLSVELKRWIDPNSPEGAAQKIGVGLVFFRPGDRAAEIGQTVEMSRDHPRANNTAD